MNKTYNNEKITAYLLGVLPAPEAEIFDELSFTDDDFADELSAAEKDLVDAYVRNDLRGTTLEQFKNYYLASPIRREKVQFAQAFQQFAEKTEAKPKRTFAGIISRLFTIPRFSLQWGFALAAVALLILGGWFYKENSRLQQEILQANTNRDEILSRENELKKREKQLLDEISNQQTANAETEKELVKVREEREKLERERQNPKVTQPQIVEKRETIQPKPANSPNRQINIASFILTPSLRGSNDLPTLSIAPNIDAAAMQLELESDDFAFYNVSLQNSDGKILWQSSKIKSRKLGTNRILNVSFPAKILKSQIYTLEVSGFSANGSAEILSNYSFRIVR